MKISTSLREMTLIWASHGGGPDPIAGQPMGGFMVDEVALGQAGFIFLPVRRSSSVSMIPPEFHTHSLICN